MIKQPSNHCYSEAISQLAMKSLYEKLICCTKFFSGSWFYILGMFFKLPLCVAVIKLCYFTMTSSVQQFKICKKKLIGFNLLADLIIFLVLGYISVDFVFVFIGFMLFSRFCKFAVNISICDNNWFVCSLKVFCVLIISSFSVGQLSTLVLYLAQG